MLDFKCVIKKLQYNSKNMKQNNYRIIQGDEKSWIRFQL